MSGDANRGYPASDCTRRVKKFLGFPARTLEEEPMIEWTIKKIIGAKNDGELKKVWPRVARINELESRIKALTDADFPAATVRLKQEVANGRPLDDILFEAFALVREAASAKASKRMSSRGLPLATSLLEAHGRRRKVGVGQRFDSRLELIDARHPGPHLLEFAVVLRADNIS